MINERHTKMITREHIDSYEKRIEEKYHRDKELIEAMRALLAESERTNDLGFSLTSHEPLTTVKQEPIILPPLEDSRAGKTLMDKVYAVTEEFSDEIWTHRRMLAFLQSIGFQLRKDQPELAVSSALSKLAKARKLKVVYHGAGNVASQYQYRRQHQGIENANGSHEQEGTEGVTEIGARTKEN
jgi:hypothetical protein